ncbi:hypothetical protein OIA45_39650 [Streptomyces chartreusis]|uniref:hypothetical protein n=1 Tax=Streptomyces chartreusis TaxID=1969 RepID=UPI00386EB34F|nr:hypothetical protein OIA45_39650 [Streptomyces chartreusis]
MATTTWPPATLPGLWVIADYHPRLGGWMRTPYARLTCPHGCLLEEYGDPADVARFVKAAAFIHARRCPGPTADHAS